MLGASGRSSDGQDPECHGCGQMESINWSAQRPNIKNTTLGVNHVGTGKGTPSSFAERNHLPWSDLYRFYRRYTVLCTLAQRENLRELVFRA